MGEIADAMLNGEFCQWCGEYLGEGDGYPVICPGCQRTHGVNAYGEKRDTKSRAVSAQGNSSRPLSARCEVCRKRCKSDAGLAQHMSDKHPDIKETP